MTVVVMVMSRKLVTMMVTAMLVMASDTDSDSGDAMMLLLVQMRMRLSPHGMVMRVVMAIMMMPLRIMMTGDGGAMMMMV